ncbi:hypothetical protein HDZ31DRAFT_33485 [Schizophyllum fasciatum]
MFAAARVSALRAARSARPAAFSGRRGMAQAAQPPHKSSDMPWIIGAGLIFGPALVYVISTPVSKGHAEGSGDHGHEAPSVKMKDGEGNEAEVGGAIGDSLSEDAPKAADATSNSPQADFYKQPESVAESAKLDKDTAPGSGSRSKPYKDEDDQSPTDMGDARAATQEKKPPKVAADEQKKSD